MKYLCSIVFRVMSIIWFLSASVAAQDVLIKNATVYDGHGGTPFKADVRVQAGTIMEIGNLAPNSGEHMIDAKGMALAPGFIDTHSHHDWGIRDAPNVISATNQGITTIVVGLDGFSKFPISNLFNGIEKKPVAVNVATYVGHNTMRALAMGKRSKEIATEADIQKMTRMLETAMHEGALGLSTGLEYEDGIYSETEEVITLAKRTAEMGGKYASHMRSEDRWFTEALDEHLRIGKETGIPVHISHIKLAKKSLWGTADKVIEKLNNARRDGIRVSADIYPYEYWSSTMAVLLPERNYADLDAIQYALDELAPPETIYLVEFEPDPTLEGKTITEIAAIKGITPAKAYSELLLAANHPETGGNEAIVAASMVEEDIIKLMQWGFTNICSDGSAAGHPRGHGSYTRVLGRYTREKGALELAEAIRKMTSLAASNVGITDRGTISIGAAADLVLFDPNTVIDNATIANSSALSDGILNVWVNGQSVYTDGKATGNRSGQIVRRAN